MIEKSQDESIADAINTITEKLGSLLLQEFLKLPQDLQINLVLIKSAQLLLANILCQVAANNEELEKIADDQGAEMKELTYTCAVTGFSNKFDINKH
ncbi:hypothetical protein [Aquicella lusitana]|uniref:Uncharacterized protein n=1 Tax=Aquicella lusitana TaxID=254246 RepID=A0A370GZ57_9COXI|nr:hypothetical protein [Aquicella lusitana]RDI48790.1 hypothetical protein C8D86_10169 [Aquicella lusitana]VVC73218.1 hypothetical protein AQULUS_09500 [Aquicella lusitana]